MGIASAAGIALIVEPEAVSAVDRPARSGCVRGRKHHALVGERSIGYTVTGAMFVRKSQPVKKRTALLHQVKGAIHNGTVGI